MSNKFSLALGLQRVYVSMFVSFIKKGNNKTKQKLINDVNTEKNEIETVAVF